MTWTIAGNSSGVLIAVTKYGNPIIRGTGSHTPPFFDDPAGPASRSDYIAIELALRRLQTVQTDWRIMPSRAVRDELSFPGADLHKRIEAQPEASIVKISCFDRESEDAPALSFDIALQPIAFQQVHELFSQVMFGPSDIEYTISLGFLTFRVPSVSAEIPTLDEFLSGHPYFSDEVSVYVRRAHRSDA